MRTTKTNKLVIGTFWSHLTTLTQRKDVTGSGAQVAQDAGFSAEVGKGKYFVARPSIKRRGICTLACWEYSLPRSNPDSKFVCALCANVRFGTSLGYEDSEFGRITFYWSLGKSWYHWKKDLPNYSWVLISSGLDQSASQTLDLERFVAEEAEHDLLCEEDSHSQGKPCASSAQQDQKAHSQGRPCAYLSKVPKPSDQSKQIIIEKATILVKVAPLNKGPPVVPIGRKILVTYPESRESVSAIWSRFRRTRRMFFFDTSLKFKNKMEQFFGPNRVRKWSTHSLTYNPGNLDAWLDVLSKKMRFEYCFDVRGERQDMRSIQDHCGVPEAGPKFFTLLEILYDWKLTYLSYRSFKEDWSQRTTSMHLVSDALVGWSWCSLHIFLLEDRTKPRTELCQPGSFAIILQNTMLTEASVIVKIRGTNSGRWETTASHRSCTHV